MKFIKNPKIYHLFCTIIKHFISYSEKIRFHRSISILLSIVLIFLATVKICFLEGKEFEGSINNTLVNDVTGLNPIYVDKVIQPTSIKEIVNTLSLTTGPISIGGGRYSQGGQVAYENSLHLDMRKFNKIISQADHEITVQSGTTWADIQDYIDPLNLSVHTMQSYANFTVGGSLSVNAHGRYMVRWFLLLSLSKLS